MQIDAGGPFVSSCQAQNRCHGVSHRARFAIRAGRARRARLYADHPALWYRSAACDTHAANIVALNARDT